jgi:hypothetical protein
MISAAASKRSFKRLGLLLTAGVWLVLSGSALADAPAPGWEITTVPYPTHLVPGGSGILRVDVFDTGAEPSLPGATLTDTLPAQITAVSGGGWECQGSTPETCTASVPAVPAGSSSKAAVLILPVSVGAGAAATEVNQVTVAGGGASAAASASDAITVSKTAAGFGVAGWGGWFSDADGLPDTQAGSHPYEATFALSFNTVSKEGHTMKAGGEVREVEVGLPRGVVADPNAAPLCTRAQVNAPNGVPECPSASQIGVAKVGLQEAGIPIEFEFPVYNLVPPAGIPAQFGFSLQGIAVFIDGSARTGGDYELVGRVGDIPDRGIVDSVVTLWGDPADRSHDPGRCTEIAGNETCGLKSEAAPEPFLTLPTSCEEASLTTTVHTSAWQDLLAAPEEANASFLSRDVDGTPVGITGCEDLAFGPSISIAPDTADTDTPAGLTADVRVPEEGLSATEGLSAADIKNTTVTLPEGLVVNPGQAAGLAACQESETAIGTEAAPSCPAASKVGTVKVKTPLLEDAAEKELEGGVYVMQSNPPNLKLLVAPSGDGVNIKLVGEVHLNEQTGQLVTTFTNTPELPFTDFKLAFSGGAQAALATPTRCATYTTEAEFTPWSTPFTANVPDTSSFEVTSGPKGSACPSGALPFSPSLSAGSTSDQAGGYTDFSLLLQNGEGQQRIEKLQFKTPPGLLGVIASVPVCPEPQAEAGACPAASQIGHVTVASGPGPYPLTIPQPGDPESPIYLTGPYEGAPFGLTIETHVIAGPFDLERNTPCDCIVTRAKIEVDPHTAQITVTTNPLPQVVDGVPTDLRLIDSLIDRPGFMFNPTNCNPLSFSGTATGTPPPGVSGPGASAPISSRFQVGSCQSLKFAPKFTVTTTGKTSKADGANLTATLAYPSAPQGTQANLTYAKFALPKQLPSRLTTLQKACLAAQFDTNPAGCPPASIVGHATVTTPLLPVPLTGPAYFVSYGGEKFPSLIIVLQGDNVTIEQVGTTFISKTGITSTTFKAVPDAPFNTFQLTLPQGPYSALTANANLCTTKQLIMPTELIAQNGAETHKNTKITVTGCPKAKKKKKAKSHAKRHNGRK